MYIFVFQNSTKMTKNFKNVLKNFVKKVEKFKLKNKTKIIQK